MSLLPCNCNGLWSAALNRRDTEGLEWFAMLHSDVAPEPFWIDTLVETAEFHNADILSVVIPFKDDTGLTSTAIAHPDDECRTHCRLTVPQVRHPSFPTTFDIDAACRALGSLPPPLRVSDAPRTALLCNTGCMICRVDRPWCDPRRVYFDEINRIVWRENGWGPAVRPEDWFFTAAAAQAGARVMATTALKINHIGGWAFPNYV